MIINENKKINEAEDAYQKFLYLKEHGSDDDRAEFWDDLDQNTKNQINAMTAYHMGHMD